MEREHITPQGVSVFHDKNESIHSFCLCLYVRAGSLFETKKENGISHFFEHIVFKNIHYAMGENLYQTLDRCGLDFNSSTYEEFIQFIITGAPAHFEEAAEILTGIFAPFTLPEEAIDTERKRIKAEIREEDEESSLNYFTKQIAWKDTSLERTITGKKKTLNKIRRKQLCAFQKKVLAANNIFFYISGNYPESSLSVLTRLLEPYSFSFLKEERENIAPVPKRFGQRKPKIYVKNSKKTCVCFSVDIDASRYTLAEKNLLFDILFEGEFCKIHQELSEKKGYVYSYDPCFQHYNNIGQMTLVYEVLPKHLYDSVETVIEVLKSMKEGITDELSYVLPHYIDNAGFLLDDTEEFNWVRAYEGHILDVYYKDIEERTESYRSVTTERMTQICREVFRQSNILLTIKGKKKKVDKERLSKILCTLD